jgi:hypothetical protein
MTWIILKGILLFLILGYAAYMDIRPAKYLTLFLLCS